MTGARRPDGIARTAGCPTEVGHLPRARALHPRVRLQSDPHDPHTPHAHPPRCLASGRHLLLAAEHARPHRVQASRAMTRIGEDLLPPARRTTRAGPERRPRSAAPGPELTERDRTGSAASSRRAPSRSCSSRSSGSCSSPLFAPSIVVGDTWLTLMAGREVIDHGLPHTEHITVLGEGATWTDQQWLAQVVFYAAHALAGMRAVILLGIALVLLALALATATARTSGASSRSTFLVGLLAVLAGPWGWTIRAQTAALPLFAGVLWLLVDASRRGIRRRTLLVLPLLVVWANLHGSVVLGAGLTVLLGVTELVRARRLAWMPARARRPRAALRPRLAVRDEADRLLRPDARRRAVRPDPPRVAVVEARARRPRSSGSSRSSRSRCSPCAAAGAASRSTSSPSSS